MAMDRIDKCLLLESLSSSKESLNSEAEVFDEKSFDWSSCVDGCLDLSNKTITRDFPEKLLELGNQVTHLFLNYNYIRDLPQSFCLQLEKLVELELDGNLLYTLPANINLLKDLQVLKFKTNRVESLPESLSELINLRILAGMSNKINSLPEGVGNLTNLEDLNMCENRIKVLPESFGLMKSLKKLDMSYNKLESLSPNFGLLQSLEIVQLCSNKLEELPESFKLLPSVTHLDLSSNNLKNLCPSFASHSVLQVISLDNNYHFCQIPEWFGSLPNIVDITMVSTDVSGEPLSESFGLISKKLKKLKMPGNRMDSLPESFSFLSLLEELDLGSDKFEPERSKHFRNGNNIYELPKEFGIHFEFMIDLRLDECGIMKLPEGFGRGIPNVKFLDLHANALMTLPDSFCEMKSLQICTLSLNGIRTLPRNFGDLLSLQELFLANNMVRRTSLSFLTDLKTDANMFFLVIVSQLTQLPLSFQSLVNLKVLDLYDNRFTVFPGLLSLLPLIKGKDVGLDVSILSPEENSDVP